MSRGKYLPRVRMYVVLFVIWVLFRLTTCNTSMQMNMFLHKRSKIQKIQPRRRFEGLRQNAVVLKKEELKESRPMADHGQAVGTKADVIIDSESSTGL